MDEVELREKLRKIEALFAGATTPGERDAAGAARDRLRAKLDDLGLREASIEMKFSLDNQFSRRLFLALCRRYGMQPYRLHRQRYTTVMLRAPESFVTRILWPEFEQLNEALVHYLDQVTTRIIGDTVHRDTSEAAEVPVALPPASR